MLAEEDLLLVPLVRPECLHLGQGVAARGHHPGVGLLFQLPEQVLVGVLSPLPLRSGGGGGGSAPGAWLCFGARHANRSPGRQVAGCVASPIHNEGPAIAFFGRGRLPGARQA